MRVIIGLLKGAVVGGGLGYLFMQLGTLLSHRLLEYALYGLIGAIVGLVAGKPLWRQETLWTPLLKAVFGVVLGVGLYALVVKVLGNPSLEFAGLQGRIASFPYVLGGAIGMVYGVFAEVDDGGK